MVCMDATVRAVDTELSDLLDQLRRCAPAERIGLREPILAHGTEALGPLLELLADSSDLGPSIASWLEALARRDDGARPAAIACLRELARRADATARYAANSLERLGIPATPRPRPGSRPTPIPRSAGSEWPGFQAHEFGRNEGTGWRSAGGQASLAPLMARVLRELDPDFISFGVERSPEIHFAVARRYKGSEVSGFTASKLVVYAHGPTVELPGCPAQVAAGWYIERGDGSEPYGSPDDAREWDWPLFLAAIGRPSYQQSLSRVMGQHGLAFGDYVTGGRYKESLGWTARIEDDRPVARDADGAVVATGWAELIGALRAVPAERWLDLHLVRTWPAADAIAAGQPFALRELAPILADIAPLYLQLL